MAEQEERMLDVYITGKHYQVPEGLTILTALEYCGYRMIRGCGCRAGFCGACATIYNFKNDPQLRYDLACQKTVEQDMYLVQIPFFPAAKSLITWRSWSRMGSRCSSFILTWLNALAVITAPGPALRPWK